MLSNKRHVTVVLLAFLSQACFSVGWSAEKSDPTTLVFPSFLHTMGIRKATKTHLRIYTRNKVKVANPQGLAVVRLHSWEDPNSQKDDDEVAGYGVNAGKNVIVYNRSMTSLGFYGLGARGYLALNNPHGICADEHGNVYVADTGNHRVVQLFNPKAELRFVTARGARGRALGSFEAPQDVALDADGGLYVCDTGNHRIQVFSPDRKVLRAIPAKPPYPGQLSYPVAVAVTNGHEKWSYFKDSFVVVIDLDGQRIQKFDLDGNLLAGSRLSALSQPGGKMMYVALDYYSNVWVTDIKRHCVHKFDRDLQYLTSFGRQGDDDNEFNEPRGIAIYKRFGQVFVAEKEAAQYFWIGTDIYNLTSLYNADHGVIEMRFFLTEPSFVSVYVRDAGGKSKQLFERQRFFSGRQNLYLDGAGRLLQKAVVENDTLRKQRNYAIAPVERGIYQFTVKVEATYSSFKYFSKEVETKLIIQ
jgi:DNA-binding beta-propeller fold protein YncE